MTADSRDGRADRGAGCFPGRERRERRLNRSIGSLESILTGTSECSVRAVQSFPAEGDFPMSCIGRQIDQYACRYRASACKPGCHDCCGPVTASVGRDGPPAAQEEAEHALPWPSGTASISTERLRGLMRNVR